MNTPGHRDRVMSTTRKWKSWKEAEWTVCEALLDADTFVPTPNQKCPCKETVTRPTVSSKGVECRMVHFPVPLSHTSLSTRTFSVEGGRWTGREKAEAWPRPRRRPGHCAEGGPRWGGGASWAQMAGGTSAWTDGELRGHTKEENHSAQSPSKAPTHSSSDQHRHREGHGASLSWKQPSVLG